MDTLILNGSDLSLEALYQVVFERRKVEIAPEALERAEKARQVLFDMAAEGKPVYGLNRGVGWNKDKEFDPDFFEQYNRNLINSHSLGVLPRCSVEEVRAMLCIRLNTASFISVPQEQRMKSLEQGCMMNLAVHATMRTHTVLVKMNTMFPLSGVRTERMPEALSLTGCSSYS